MRIIAGTHKGRSLRYPKNKFFRPTQDRVKEALFSMLMPYIPEANVLDLCCGTGSFGFESLSRGATSAVLVDRDVSYAQHNAKELALSASIIKSDVKTYLHKTSDRFDVLFFDPPYADHQLYTHVLETIQHHMNSGAVLMVEHEKGHDLPPQELLSPLKTATYGTTSITLYTL